MTLVSNENLNVATWKIPSPLGIIGSGSHGEYNGMTASWITQINMDPLLIAVGVDNKSVTHDLMTRSDYFTINLFSNAYTKVFVKFSKPAIYSEGFLNKEPITLSSNNVPIFNNALVWFELSKKEVHNYGTHSLYIGEVVDCKAVDSDDRIAYMGDTRMKYGGVPRGGH
jgi:flavin reductase